MGLFSFFKKNKSRYTDEDVESLKKLLAMDDRSDPIKPSMSLGEGYAYSDLYVTQYTYPEGVLIPKGEKTKSKYTELRDSWKNSRSVHERDGNDITDKCPQVF